MFTNWEMIDTVLIVSGALFWIILGVLSVIVIVELVRRVFTRLTWRFYGKHTVDEVIRFSLWLKEANPELWEKHIGRTRALHTRFVIHYLCIRFKYDI